MKTIYVLAKSIGLEYDDRIRKECISLKKKNKVKILVVLDSNESKKGFTSFGVEYCSISLKSRELFPSSRFLIIKALEFYFKTYRLLREADIVWAHEEYTFLFPLLSEKNQYIWDLHEIPKFFQPLYMKRIFHIIENKSIKILHANKARMDYLHSIGLIRDIQKHDFINNYPDKLFLSSKSEDKNLKKFKEWVKDEEYIYLQGLSLSQRNPLVTLQAIIECGIKTVVVGNVDKTALQSFKKKYSENKINSMIFFTGQINQLDITQYIKNCKFSIITYDSSSINQIYCEPNRLYQALSMGKPVIVSKNPTMKNLIQNNCYGIVLDDYGENKLTLLDSIDLMEKNYSKFFNKINIHKDNFIWKDKLVNEKIQ